jgi:hypothetical protein
MALFMSNFVIVMLQVMDYECTQAIPLSDYEEETDDGHTGDKNPVRLSDCILSYLYLTK